MQQQELRERRLALPFVAGLLVACSNVVGGQGGPPDASGTPPPPPVKTDEVDLLFVVDDSSSMQDKQAILAQSIERLLTGLVDPPCIDATGEVVAQPSSPTVECPGASVRRFGAVRSLHIGVIDTSLGGLGADACSAADATRHNDDRGHLLTRSTVGSAVPTYLGYGFLAWDPDQRLSPPGETSLHTLVEDTVALVEGAGESGCGFEMPLEAAYRFLADPFPYASIALSGAGSIPPADEVGVDVELLAERERFLRPSSLVSVVLLSDENDCSVVAGGQAYAVLDTAPFFRASSACAADPTATCCYSCGLPPPSACSADPICSDPYLPVTDDGLNLRCWDQKRRFGIDLLYPVARYVNAFTEPTIDPRRLTLASDPNDASSSVPNPLFAKGRAPSLFAMTAIVGVPWQAIAREPSSPASGTLSAAELAGSGFWPREVGDPSVYLAPSDPYMVESWQPRSGVDASGPNGGDRSIDASPPNDLQYSCIFALPEPLLAGQSFDCKAGSAQGNPICMGNVQVAGKAYPGLRQLAVLEGLGERAAVGSICPPTLDPNDAGASSAFAYHAAMDATIDVLARSLSR